jgi:rubrerythrin
MEEKLAAFHMSQMHIFSDESTNKLFTSMMNNDNDHLEALKKAFDNLL